MVRFPPALLDRAAQLITEINDESIVRLINASRADKSKSFNQSADEVSNEISDMEKDVIDLYSYVLLLMSTESDKKYDYISIDVINQKLEQLIEAMSPAFKDLLKESSLEEIISILNASKSFDWINYKFYFAKGLINER